jgi:Xaa-Pro aminopeptidase
VKDVRDGRNHWADNAIERLSELKFPLKRIGVSGLIGLIRAPDGIVPYTTVEKLKAAFPSAEIVNATSLIQDVRSVKSEEEIRLMRRSEAIIEKMIAAMTKAARPGATERHLYATLVHTMLENGGEQPSLLIFGTGRGIGHGQFVPTDRKLKKGDLVVNEIEARYAGYSAQSVAPISIGKPSKQYSDLLDTAIACFENVREKMRAGETLGSIMDTYTRTVEREGKGRYGWAHPIMHARGLGDESPALLGDSDVARFRRIELKPGMTFILKPRVRLAKNGLSAQIGDTVLVTPKGGERLGKRKMALAVIG